MKNLTSKRKIARIRSLPAAQQLRGGRGPRPVAHCAGGEEGATRSPLGRGRRGSSPVQQDSRQERRGLMNPGQADPDGSPRGQTSIAFS
jgi:hypothetical protein